MATVIKKKSGLKTVGDLVEALRRFPVDMPISVGCDDEATVYQAKPQRGESYPDKRGQICVDGGDPWA